MTSVERIASYTSLPQEENISNTQIYPEIGWPLLGSIKFENVYLKYERSEFPSLIDISIHIKGSEKVLQYDNNLNSM